MEKARGRKPESVRIAWDNLKKLRAIGAKEAKAKTLWEFMKKGCDEMETEWVEMIMSFEDTISKSITKAKEGRKMYPGELRRLHGATRLARLARTNVFKKTKDEAGNECYVKVTETQTIEKKREQKLARRAYPYR